MGHIRSGAVNAHLRRDGGRTDLGEMAQMATSEALTAVGTPVTARTLSQA